MCKVAVDESIGEDLFKVLDDEHCVTMRLITNKNASIIKRIRKHPCSSKVRGVDDNFDAILADIRQDMERVRIESKSKSTDKLEKVRLPNFMKLRLRDKAELIRYRNNLYCLINLHRDKSDL